MKRKGLVFLSALFVAVLSLMLGISALAAGNDGSDEVSSVSSGTELTPEIVSKNVSYGSNLHIYYAVPVSTVAEGATVSMEFYKSAPTEGAEPFYTVTDYEVQIISAITGSNVNYYVFRSRGFAAKNIGDEIYAVPVSTVGDTAARGEAVKYSIAEYCYERLYKGGFIDKTEEDGDDFSRRELYVSVLEYASAAQQLFYIDKGIDATLVNSLTYYSVSGSNLGVPNGFTDLLTEGKLELSADTAVGDNGTAFASWQMKVYRNGVLQYTDAYTSASHTVTVPEGCSVVISPVIDIVDEHLYRLWEIAEQEKLDEVEVEKQWAALEEKCIEEYGETVGPELVEALKKFYSMYDDAIADWSASIYSKGYMDLDAGQWAGGYYASTGGRDTAGLGPDVQCTEQMLRFISQSGMINHYGGSVTTAIRADLPWMEYQLVYFTLSLQESNGYFYHPQWGIEATDSHLSRRGRDIGWACSILERFYVTPEYETPNGRFPKTESDKNYEKYSAPTSAEEYMAWLISEGLISESEIPETYKNQVSSGASSVALTSYVSSSVSVAVSKVIAAADDGGTAHLDSYEGFLNYLVNEVIPGLQSNPYNMGNEISSISSELSIASEKLENKYGVFEYDSSTHPIEYEVYDGLTVKEMMIKALNSSINPDIGLWGEKSEKNPTGTEFLFTNGFMKVMAIYNDWKIAYPYPVKATEALMTGLCSDQASTGNICEVYNIWTALDRLKSNINSYYNADAIVETIDGVTPTKEVLQNKITEALGEKAAEAVLTSWEKMKGYQKVDYGFSHNYYSGTDSHQGLPVSNGTNVADVDATCIGVTGISREIFAVLGLTSYKPQIYTKSDWMRYCMILEEANSVNKGFADDAEISFSNATIPEDVDVYNGTVTVVENNGSNALELSGNQGSALILKLSDISSVGSVAQIVMDLTFKNVGSYQLAVEAYQGKTVSLTLNVTNSSLTVTDDISGKSYSTAYTLGSIVNIKIEIGVEVTATNYVTVANLSLGGVFCGEIVRYVEADGYYAMTSLTSLTKVKFVQGSAGNVVFDNIRFVLTSSTRPSDFEDAELGDTGSEFADGGFGLTYESDGKATITVEEESGNKYLHFDKSLSTESGANGGGHAYFGLVGSSGSGNILTFETRIRISPTYTNKVIKINLKTASGKIPWQIQFYNNSTLRLYYSGDENVYETVTNNIPLGEWITLKVVVATDSANATLTSETYVNGDLLYTFNGPSIDYVEANTITSFWVIPNMGWVGDVDLDDMSMKFGGERAAETETKVQTQPPYVTHSTSCGTDHYEILKYEQVKAPTCTEAGELHKITEIICDSCASGKSVDKITLDAAHTQVVELHENETAPTCKCGGSYDLVTYCEACESELERETIYTDADPDAHSYEGGKCTVCGALKVVTFEQFTPNDNWVYDSTLDTLINFYKESGAEASCVVNEEDGNKYISVTKTNTGSSAWQVFEIDPNADTSSGIRFRTDMRYTHSAGGYEINVRFYSGRKASSPSGGGSELGTKKVNSDEQIGTTAYDELYRTSFKASGDYMVIAGVTTDVKFGEWFTYEVSIESNGVTITVTSIRGDKKYITYTGDYSAITTVQFMYQYQDRATLDFDNVYFGGK